MASEIANALWRKARLGGIRMEGFRSAFNEAVFPDSENETREPLLGYIVLEQAQAAVDMVGQRCR